MRTALVLLLALGCVAAAAAAGAEELTAEQQQVRSEVLAEMRVAHPPRQSRRRVDGMHSMLAERARLMFRTMDSNRDRALDQQDVVAQVDNLDKLLPGVSPSDLAAFIQVMDQNGDGKLSPQEFTEGLEQGVQNVQLLETGSSVQASRRGIFSSVKGWFQKWTKKATKAKKRAAPKKKKANPKKQANNDACVMCQYIVERCETNVKQAGVIPAMTGATMGPSIFLEESMTIGAKQTPFDQAASSIIGSTRQSTRYQRQLERQKFNEIYRVVDITLDDVCEQGMPNDFYPYCMVVYKTQSDLVDGLRYQYRPADICFRIGMCGDKSYITKGIHSRYKQAGKGRR